MRNPTGRKYHIDTGNVTGYPERIVDDVELIGKPAKYAKKVLCHSPKLRANILVPRKELKPIGQGQTENLKDIRTRKAEP